MPFEDKFRELFENITKQVKKEESEAGVFSKIKNYAIDFYSLASHPLNYILKKMNNIKTTAGILEYNKLIKETWYRNEERLFRILAKMLTSQEYINLLNSNEFKDFIEKKHVDDWFKDEVIGLTRDFLESTYFSDLARNKNFVKKSEEFFSALPSDIQEQLSLKLDNQLKRLGFDEKKYGGSDASVVDQIKGNLGVVAGFIGAFAVGAYVSVFFGIAVAAVPALYWFYNSYKLVQTKEQKGNLNLINESLKKVTKNKNERQK